MRVARVRVNGLALPAVVKDGRVHLVGGTVLDPLEETGESYDISDVTFLAPTVPGKIIAIGINYKSHAGERTPPSEPQAFLKPPSSLIGPDQAIVLPPDATNVHAEAEVVAVIGRRASRITEDEVDACVFGYTAGNDVSGRDWQRNDLQWLRAKGTDTFATAGPWIDTSLTPDAIPVTGLINQRIQQEADTSLLIHSIRKCIAHVSQYVTLEPGDMVYTGTPGQTGEIRDGDVCEVRVADMTLRNPVRARSAHG